MLINIAPVLINMATQSTDYPKNIQGRNNHSTILKELIMGGGKGRVLRE